MKTRSERDRSFSPIIALLLFSVTVSGAGVLYARWEGKQSNKSAADLKSMTEEELFNEAFDVCVGRALHEGPAAASEGEANPVDSGASAYLATIADALSTRHDGSVPEWMTTLQSARTGKECQHGFDAFLEAQAPAKPKIKAKKAAPTPPQRPSTQLPPWLVPQ